MKHDLIQFLFVDSQLEEEASNFSAELSALFEKADKDEALSVKKTPLTSALKEIGIESENLELDARGFALVTSDGDEFRSVCSILAEPSNLHKLAELGWVCSHPGDVAMTGEQPEYHIRFMDISTVGTDSKEKAEKTKSIIKNAREFATTELDREDDFKKPSGDGVGKAEPGSKAGHDIHDSITGFELAMKLIEDDTRKPSESSARTQPMSTAGKAVLSLLKEAGISSHNYEWNGGLFTSNPEKVPSILKALDESGRFGKTRYDRSSGRIWLETVDFKSNIKFKVPLKSKKVDKTFSQARPAANAVAPKPRPNDKKKNKS